MSARDFKFSLAAATQRAADRRYLLMKPEPVAVWRVIVETLKRSRGSWYTILFDTSTAVTNISGGGLADFRPAGDFEAERVDGVLRVRYVGLAAHDDVEATR